ncbi:MAG TPA: cupin domain-containing protein [Gemmataceae bacterium]|jgi:quercetin dioxygenase-like cupin family protein
MTTRHIKFFALALLATSPAGSVALAQHEHVLQNEQDVKWVDAPKFLPPGAKIAVVEGNPAEKAPFTIRLKLPANYKIPAHSHPGDEHVVVLSGSLYMGTGDKLDMEKSTALKVGGFGLMPAKMNHFAYTKDATTILVYGTGPVDFLYVNPEDDPRKAEKK